ncbi:transglutaminase-like domain-containing protein [Dyella lutea]|uniref:Transglutaminase-like domain-containing protein n=1 Tax=Dyella lutea TaxID=2950441 RepID=A0ABT1FE62_9GAMM|nr:transglutaminase-like domain-containing protein [Dyella lutea]MCP1374373.1 transglutaminase-like domain-containing protein [Dyella lutea]
MRPTAVMLLYIGLAGLSLAHSAADTRPPHQTTWMTVLIDGRKIGSLRVDRDFDGARITTTQTLSIELLRAGKPLRLQSVIGTTESIDGEPLGFSATSALSSVDNTVAAERLGPGTFEVTTSVGGQHHVGKVTLPPGTLMFDGQRRAMEAAEGEKGTTYQLRQFDPVSQQIMQVEMQVIGPETVNLPDGSRTLSHQRQRLRLPNGDQVVDLWLDDQGIAQKGELQLLGQRLDMLACDKACALAPVQRVDMFRTAMVESPRPLTVNLRAVPLTYRIRLGKAATRLLIQTDEQDVRPIDAREVFLDVHRAQAGKEAGPVPADTAANPWVQSDAPAIADLAAKVVGHVQDPRDKMRRLRMFVSGYVTEHGLDVGYASALEVLKNRRGDCTEFAVLLAALARAQGIPTRVVTGMVYADRYAGTLRVFVPHAWVQSWVDGRWESYDAALRQFDSTHIALTTGDGDPSRYFSATQLFGQLKIESVRPSNEFNPPVSPPTAPPPTTGTPTGRG